MSDVHAEVRGEPLDDERSVRREFALSQLRRYPDPVLRMRAHEVEDFDDDLGRLVERMTFLMREANGVGLAANQVGVLRRVFVMQPDPESEPVVVVNPVLASASPEREEGDEGCLSMPNVLAPVERSVAVRLEGRSVDGSAFAIELDGLGARVAQHEVDHLDGILILDRTTRGARREALAALRPQPSLDRA